jgi:hypothetical protein
VATPFANLNSAETEQPPYLTPDERTIYFSRRVVYGDGGSSVDILRATRMDADAVFDAPVPAPGLVNVPTDEDSIPVVTGDEKKLFITKRFPADDYNVFLSERSTVATGWGKPVPLTTVNSAGGDTASDWLDGELWLHTYQSGVYRIVRAPPSGSSFGAPVPVTELGTGVIMPRITRDGARLYYSKISNGGNGEDIFVAVRTPGGPFVPEAAPVPNVNSTALDRPAWISPDECRLYLVSMRVPGAGGFDIYVASRPR